MSESTSLRHRVVQGVAWSAVSTMLLRLGGLVVGIVIARVLTPTEFGVYAVALTVQAILITLADLGLSADIIRSEEPEKIAPTVATLSLVSGVTLTALTVASSSHIATLLGASEAADAIAVLSFTLLLAGATVVPSAMLQRRFQQKQLFYVGVADFTVSTIVTLTLVFAGFGVMGLAIGRVAAQSVSTILQFLLARVVPRFSIDRSLLRPVLAFGLPIAAANLLSWVLLNADKVILARVAGATALGYYVLAFNISSWPMTALSQVVRSVSLPFFSRMGNRDGLPIVMAFAWAAALPAGVILAALSNPLVEVVYGTKWLPAAPVLAILGIYGALRVIFDLFASYLYAKIGSGGVFWIQVLWLAVLIVSMIPSIRSYGLIGAAWVHLVVAATIVLPAYLLLLKLSGVLLRPLASAVVWPTLATAPAAASALATRHFIESPLLALLLGGAASVMVYLVLLWPWMRRYLHLIKQTAG